MTRLMLLAFFLFMPVMALAAGVPTTASSPTPTVWDRQVGVAADTLVKTGPGILHTVTCGSDAAATAGTLDIRDAVAAGAGTVLTTITFVAAYFPPVTLTFDYPFTTGLHLDFTTTADVTCTVSYR